MWRAIGTWWKYLGAKLNVLHDEHADPKVQLEQALAEARAQHRRLTEQAANVIANQQQVQRRLDRAVGRLREGRRVGPPGPAARRSRGAIGRRAASCRSAAGGRVPGRSIGGHRAGGPGDRAAAAAGHPGRGERQGGRRAQRRRPCVGAWRTGRSSSRPSTRPRCRRRSTRRCSRSRGRWAIRCPRSKRCSARSRLGWPGPRAWPSWRRPEPIPLDVHLLEIEQAQLSAGAQARLAEMRVSLGLAPATAELVRFDRKELER